jgi:Arc/MetJ-type ribon-helix-helix transcriptional regulator
MKRNPETVSSKIPKTLREAMKKYINRDTHLNESDFIRNAIREKILRDAPWIIKDLLEEE